MVVVPFTDSSARRAEPRRSIPTAPLPERLPISATVIACDEERRIGPCLEGLLTLVDQVIVLDSGSKDRTREIATAMGVEVHVAEWQGYGPQKRRAEKLCRHDWVLSLDADERLSPAVVAEIRRIFAGDGPSADAYRLRIVDQFPHEKEPAFWAFAYRRIRLYNQRKGRYADSLVHDDVVMQDGAEVRDLGGSVQHVSIENLASSIDKYNRYTNLQIEDLRLRERRLPRWRLLTEIPFAFFKSYILRRRVFYGWWGVIHSMNYAYMRFLRVAKSYEDAALSGDD